MTHTTRSPQRRQPSQPAGAPLTWEHPIPVLTNPLLWYDLTKVLLIAVLLIEGLGAALTYMIDGEVLAVPWQAWLIPLGILAVLFVLVGLLMRNRSNARFSLDADGAMYEAVTEMDRYERTVNRVAGLLGLLTNGLAGAGARVFGVGGVTQIPWEEVERVRYHPKLHAITLSDSWHAVIRLYCPADQYGAVTERVRAGADAGAAWRAAHPVVRNSRPVWFYIAWVVLSVGATLACDAWWLGSYHATDRIAVAAGVLVLLSGVLIRLWWAKLLAYAALPVLVLYLVKLGIAAWEPIAGDAARGRSYTLDTPLLGVAVLGGLVLMALSLYRARGVGDTW